MYSTWTHDYVLYEPVEPGDAKNLPTSDLVGGSLQILMMRLRVATAMSPAKPYSSKKQTSPPSLTSFTSGAFTCCVMLTFVNVNRPEGGFSHMLMTGSRPIALQSQSEAALITQFHFCDLWSLYMLC